MGAVELELFNDITRRKLVVSDKDESPFTLAPWKHQDLIPILITFLKVLPGGNRQSSPYSKLLSSGLSLAVRLYKSDGVTVLASQDVWTVIGQNQLFAVLNLNTANMLIEFPALPGGAAITEITTILEFELNDGTGNITTWQDKTFKVNREYKTVGSPVAVAGETYYTKAQIDALFLKKLCDAGDTLTLKSPDSSKQRILGVRNEGEGQDDIIS